jgi:hypothetical protein
MRTPLKTHLKIALAAVLALLASFALAAEEPIGVVKRSAGQVTIERSGAQLPALAGVEVHRGDRLLTGPDGYASISLRGTAPVSVGPGADVDVGRFVRDQRPITQRFIDPLVAGVASFMGGITRR